MTLLGKIVKGVIHVGNTLIAEDESPLALQEATLRELLNKAKDTHFGRHYNFESILRSDNVAKAFAEAVPMHTYNDIFDQWWHRLLEGESDVCWPGAVEYFALSSGTSGAPSKHIPVTDDMIQAIRKTGIKQVMSLANFDLPSDIFEKEILMLGSSTDLVNKGKYFEGEISGISASKIPFWFDNYYKPGRDIAKIDEWEERIHNIAVKAPTWDIGALSGIPAWIQLMLERVIEYHRLENIHQIWPNLSIYATGGVAFEPYRKGFERLLAHPLIYVDTYLASEGFLAFQSRPETQAMALVLNNGIYFEFVPFNGDNFSDDGDILPNAKALTIGEVEEEKEYALLISTCSGAWRYLLGDTIRFTDKDRNEIVITGRTKHFLNVAGSQMTVEHMNNTMKMLEDELGIVIREFVVSAIPHGNHFAHKWYIGCETPFDTAVAREKLDNYLKQINKNYRVARSKALKEVFVEVIDPEYFNKWHAATKKMGGQVKTPRVMKAEKFFEFEAFVKKQGEDEVMEA